MIVQWIGKLIWLFTDNRLCTGCGFYVSIEEFSEGAVFLKSTGRDGVTHRILFCPVCRRTLTAMAHLERGEHSEEFKRSLDGVNVEDPFQDPFNRMP